MGTKIDPRTSQAMQQLARKLGEKETRSIQDTLGPAKTAALVNKLNHTLANGRPLPPAVVDAISEHLPIDGNLALAAVAEETGVAPGLSGSLLSMVSDPSALMSQMHANLGGTDLVSAAMTAQTLTALDALGLSSLPTQVKAELVNSFGGFVNTQAGMLPTSMLGQQLLAVASRDQAFLDLAGTRVLSALDQRDITAMGSNFFQTLQGNRPEVWARDVLGRIGPRYFNDFDSRTLEAMRDRQLSPFARNLMSDVIGLGPAAAGRELLADITSPMRQELGQRLLAATPDALRGDLGGLLLDAMRKNPLEVGERYLRQVGTKELAKVGNKLFQNIPGLAGKDASSLAGGLAGALLGGGDVKKNLLNVAMDFGKGKLRDLGQNMLNKYAMPLLKQAGGKVLDWAKNTAIGKLGAGLLDKIGGKVLDKLGGIGKIASGALSVLNGKLDTKKMLQMAMNFIPVVGPILGVLSSLPVVGKLFDKVLGGVAKVLNKIPGVGLVLKGVASAVNFVGKGVKAIGKGVKKVGQAVAKGVKKVGKAIAKGVKSVGKAVKKFFKKW